MMSVMMISCKEDKSSQHRLLSIFSPLLSLSLSLAQIALLSGSTPKKARDQVYDACASGVVSIVVGTHSLINESLSFKDLGLAVIDEQHKFGVRGREAVGLR